MKRIGSMLLGAVFCVAALAGCAGGGSENVQFWVMGQSDQIDMYTRVVDAFNEGYGREHGIRVDISQKPNTSYTTLVQTMASSSSGPDVFLVEDADFKGWIIGQYFGPIQEYVDQVTDIDISDIMPMTINRLRYDVETNTSHEDDPLYALPIDNRPTALYYNKTMLEKAGINVISVDEEDLEEWNANEIPDRTGKYKRDFPDLADVTVPAKGYYRSQSPYYYNGDRTAEWRKPDIENGEVCVFNNRIAMNWDEVEDLAMLFSGSYNPAPGQESAENPTTEFGTEYGYFTEWWFNYGWSVGGDCLNDLTDNGDWNFSLLDPNPNYIVLDGTFTGRTGTVYEEGETIGFVDKMDILEKDGAEEVLIPDIYGDYVHDNENVRKDGDGNVVGGDYAGIWEGIAAGVEAGTLGEMMSTRDAFCRYLKLGAKSDADIDGERGLNVSPNPSSFGSRTSMNYFFSGKLALLAQESVYMPSLAEEAKKRNFEWDVAPLVIYKEYTDPSNPDCDEVKVRGKDAGHSILSSMVVRSGSSKKLEAETFMMWAASREGQSVRASLGFFPNQKDLIEKIEFKQGVAPHNAVVFSEALEFQGPGDWWYMPDHLWVEQWCVDLNADVRNGKMSFADWYSPAIIRTNDYLNDHFHNIERG